MPLNWNLSTEAGLRGACFWITDKRSMPADEASPASNRRYSQGEERAGVLVMSRLQLVSACRARMTKQPCGTSGFCVTCKLHCKQQQTPASPHPSLLPGRHLEGHPPLGLVELAAAGAHAGADPAGEAPLPLSS